MRLNDGTKVRSVAQQYKSFSEEKERLKGCGFVETQDNKDKICKIFGFCCAKNEEEKRKLYFIINELFLDIILQKSLKVLFLSITCMVSYHSFS